MPTKESLVIHTDRMGHGNELSVTVSEDNYISFENNETDATNFWFQLDILEWEKIRDYVESKLPAG